MESKAKLKDTNPSYYEKKLAYSKTYYWEHRDEVLEKRRKKRGRKPKTVYTDAELARMEEKKRENAKKYYERHKEERLEYQKKYYREHKDEILDRVKKDREFKKQILGLTK